MSVGTVKGIIKDRRVSVPYVRDVRWDNATRYSEKTNVSVPYVRDVRWDFMRRRKMTAYVVSVPYVRDVRWDTYIRSGIRRVFQSLT